MRSRPSYVELMEGILRFGRFRRRWSVFEGLARFTLLGPGVLLAWFFLDWVFELPSWPLVLAFMAAAALTLYAAARWVIRPQFQRIDAEREALVMEAIHGRLDNQIIGSLQLGRDVEEAHRSRGSLGYSPDYVAALVDQAAEAVRREDLCTLLDLSRARKRLRAAGVVAAVSAACLLLAPAAIVQRADRLRDAYAAILDALFPVSWRVRPGDLAVVRGRPVTLEVDVLGARRVEVTLVRADLGGAAESRTPLRLQGGKAAFRVAEAMDSFRYQFEYARRRTPQHRILVGDLPQIRAIHYELAYPAYTGQPPRTLTGRVPKLHGLVGTAVLVSFAATTELHPEMSRVEWQDGTRQSLSITGRYGHFSFTIGRPERATVYLTGVYGRGFEMEQPVSFEVIVQKDDPPAVQALVQSRKMTLLAEEAALFGLHFLAEDDFGVSEVQLNYRIDTVDELLGRSARDGAMPRRIEPPRDRVKGGFLEVFKTLSPPLEPGDRITLTVSAKDNNTETGPSLGRSLPIEIVVVRQDLAGFVEQQYGFDAQSLLGGLKKVQRATNLLIEPIRTVRTEVRQPLERQDVKARVSQETWPRGAEDLVGDYFRLLAGEK